VIHGDVQGVGFRYFVMRNARGLGLRGSLRNPADGTVELTAEGDRAALEKLLEAARQGPRGARVADVDVQWSAAKGGLDPFDLTY